MGTKDPRVDSYIAKSADFARPILKHLRKVVHTSFPEVEETLKWGSPAFMHHGILAGMAAFKEHCVFGFWKHSLLSTPRGGPNGTADAAMGRFSRITSLADLPPDRTIARWVKEAADLNERGVKVPRKPAAKAARRLPVPAWFKAALRGNRKALATFEGFSPSHRNEYVEWVTEAKTDATRQRRIETALQWMAEGKSRNWKYMRK
jgi:uncharacterized protein YdeI (YjbR/CyaY-like superfamily)